MELLQERCTVADAKTSNLDLTVMEMTDEEIGA